VCENTAKRPDVSPPADRLPARLLGTHVRHRAADQSRRRFIDAGLTLLGLGLNALSSTNPYRTSLNQSAQATFGGAELTDLIAHACEIALKAVY
jgi:hypothetical protein